MKMQIETNGGESPMLSTNLTLARRLSSLAVQAALVAALILPAFATHARGGSDLGGMHVIPGNAVDEVYDTYHTSTITRLDPLREAAYMQVAFPRLKNFQDIVPELGTDLRRMTFVKAWNLDTKGFTCTLVSFVIAPTAEALACQDDVEIRISKQRYERLGQGPGGLQAQARFFIHEIVRAWARQFRDPTTGRNSRMPDEKIFALTNLIMDESSPDAIVQKLADLGLGQFTGIRLADRTPGRIGSLAMRNFAKTMNLDVLKDLNEKLCSEVNSPVLALAQADELGYHNYLKTAFTSGQIAQLLPPSKAMKPEDSLMKINSSLQAHLLEVTAEFGRKAAEYQAVRIQCVEKDFELRRLHDQQRRQVPAQRNLVENTFQWLNSFINKNATPEQSLAAEIVRVTEEATQICGQSHQKAQLLGFMNSQNFAEFTSAISKSQELPENSQKPFLISCYVSGDSSWFFHQQSTVQENLRAGYVQLSCIQSSEYTTRWQLPIAGSAIVPTAVLVPLSQEYPEVIADYSADDLSIFRAANRIYSPVLNRLMTLALGSTNRIESTIEERCDELEKNIRTYERSNDDIHFMEIIKRQK